MKSGFYGGNTILRDMGVLCYRGSDEGKSLQITSESSMIDAKEPLKVALL